MEVYNDIPRIYTGIAQIGSCFLYIILLEKEGNHLIRAVKFLMATLIQCGFLQLTGNVPRFLWIPCMILSFGLMYVYLYANLSMDAVSLWVIAIRSFILAETIASVEWEIYSMVTLGRERSAWLSVVMMLLVYSLLLAGVYFLERSLIKSSFRPVYSVSEAIASAVIAAGIFAISNIGYLMKSGGLELPYLWIFNTRMLVDLGGMAILYAYQFRISQLQAQRELISMSADLRLQYEHYRDYQETLELINIRYHDLKHHTERLRAELDPEQRSVHLRELENELKEFAPDHQTGSPVLDTLLLGKSVKMKNLRIHFTCVADGSLLEKMHVTDICTIFGNALDNAIECEALVEDEEKRIISMTLARKKDFIYIEVSNYCERPITMKDGLPVTTKEDKALHGYGVRSMLYTVRKYSGTLTFDWRSCFLEMKILIPV